MKVTIFLQSIIFLLIKSSVNGMFPKSYDLVVEQVKNVLGKSNLTIESFLNIYGPHQPTEIALWKEILFHKKDNIHTIGWYLNTVSRKSFISLYIIYNIFSLL